MTFVPITDAEIDVDSPVTQVLMTKYRDNIDFSALPISTTIISTPVASVELTGFNAAQYNSYEIELINVSTSSDNDGLILRTSSDGGATYDSGSTDYSFSISASYINITSVQGSAGLSQATLAFNVGAASGEHGVSGTLRISGPHLARNTVINSQLTYQFTNGDAYRNNGGIVRKSAADVDAVQIYFANGNVASGTIIFRGFK